MNIKSSKGLFMWLTEKVETSRILTSLTRNLGYLILIFLLSPSVSATNTKSISDKLPNDGPRSGIEHLAVGYACILRVTNLGGEASAVIPAHLQEYFEVQIYEDPKCEGVYVGLAAICFSASYGGTPCPHIDNPRNKRALHSLSMKTSLFNALSLSLEGKVKINLFGLANASAYHPIDSEVPVGNMLEFFSSD